MKSILVIGLPSSGKTTLSNRIYNLFKPYANLHDADEVRKEFDDWDFSLEGRQRQAYRMKMLSDLDKRNGIYSICNFICPLEEFRKIFKPDILIWLDTIKESKYKDTNNLFEEPTNCNYHITDFNQINDLLSNLEQTCKCK